jgi:hypothetical protein
MNEQAGASIMVDSVNGINGAIGSAVATGVDFGNGELGYRWSDVKPNQPPATPERLIQIDDSRLNPGDRDYAITFRYRTTRPFGNIMQKGQSAARGGNWKIQLPQGDVSCLFHGSIQKRAVRSTYPYDDGTWHVVRCERDNDGTDGTAAGVTLTVYDGTGSTILETKRLRGATGTISNKVPMTIGGKVNCDQITTTCDYFAGDIDWVTVETS